MAAEPFPGRSAGAKPREPLERVAGQGGAAEAERRGAEGVTVGSLQHERTPPPVYLGAKRIATEMMT